MATTLNHNIEKHLARIKFIHQEGEDLTDRLIRLHRCHSLAIPFENFNPFCQMPVSLSIDEAFDKIIMRNRGGYCFELNLLFHSLLVHFGYRVKSILARPYSGDTGGKLPLTHRLLTVTLQGTTWLVDVGLGGNGWVEPLAFCPGEEQTQMKKVYRILPDPDMGYVVQLKRGARFINALAFGFQYAEESDFAMSNYYTSTHPDSPFVRQMICTLPTVDGRYSIRGTTFKTEINGVVKEQELTVRTFNEILARYFAIELPDRMREHIYTRLKAIGAK